MAIEITSIDEAIQDTGLKILVHGPAGAGKTVLSATAQKPTFLINTEAGLLSLKNIPERIKKNIKTAKITCMADLEEAYDILADADEPICDWVCLDSISEIAEVVLGEEKKDAGDARQAYGALADRMYELLRLFRDLPGYNVLMTAKQTRIEDQDTGRTMYYPMLPGKQLTFGIAYLFDEVFALHVEYNKKTGESKRILQTDRDNRYDCKDRSGSLDMFEKPSLKHIEMKIRGDDYIPYEKKVAGIDPIDIADLDEEITDHENVIDPIDPEEDVFIEEEIIETGGTETAEVVE